MELRGSCMTSSPDTYGGFPFMGVKSHSADRLSIFTHSSRCRRPPPQQHNSVSSLPLPGKKKQQLLQIINVRPIFRWCMIASEAPAHVYQRISSAAFHFDFSSRDCGQTLFSKHFLQTSFQLVMCTSILLPIYRNHSQNYIDKFKKYIYFNST